MRGVAWIGTGRLASKEPVSFLEPALGSTIPVMLPNGPRLAGTRQRLSLRGAGVLEVGCVALHGL